MAWEHAPDMVAALVSITLLVYPRFYPLRPTCFPRYFLHLGYNLLLEMVLELMPCATRSRLWCGFDADSSRLPSPFSSFLSSVVLLLMTLWVSVVIFASYFSCFFLFRCLLCDYIANPSSLCSAYHHSVRHHSPALHPVFKQLVPTARSIVTPRRPGGSSGIHP